ncbi:hypothetical protein Hypma_003482 [Hypsizygus marmoreus]|uniref:Uncharacterized protein n=1 Tax=Hypsizygus marmoreus TaxID=39966 RepID=A0A369J6I4_HYPMA|nr:hypothetical protein Hypma_003482 [Hypsizygus marmoreus]
MLLQSLAHLLLFVALMRGQDTNITAVTEAFNTANIPINLDS